MSGVGRVKLERELADIRLLVRQAFPDNDRVAGTSLALRLRWMRDAMLRLCNAVSALDRHVEELQGGAKAPAPGTKAKPRRIVQ